MNKHLKRCLERTIKQEFVSVYHDYDTQETTYSVPYNAALTPRSVRLMLIRAMGLDYGEDFDDKDPNDIDKMSSFLIDEWTPLFSLTSKHTINKNGVLLTNYRIDFDGEVLFEKAYASNNLANKNPMIQLMHRCSEKIIDQERIAQEQKMEKMFISTNLFKWNAQHDRK